MTCKVPIYEHTYTVHYINKLTYIEVTWGQDLVYIQFMYFIIYFDFPKDLILIVLKAQLSLSQQVVSGIHQFVCKHYHET